MKRAVISSIGVASTVALAGCIDDLSSEDGTSGDGGAGSGSDDGNEENCRMETTVEEEKLVDEWESYSAGERGLYRLDLEMDDEIEVTARQTGGEARPAVSIEDPSGATIADIGPEEHISREFAASDDGRHYVTFENEAIINSGEWDISIIIKKEVEEEVCD
ncbi:hypothetical protein JCM18750_08300 [Halostagnicola bangensis]